ncbi:hypothetical protein P8452_51720 [Trifolium repens]|nr:hypothetical protein P8452_51720 [Trifolium repens]
METTPSHKRFREFSLRNEFWNFAEGLEHKINTFRGQLKADRICFWIGLYFIGFIISGQEMRAVAISKIGHKMQNFAEGLEHKINTFRGQLKADRLSGART